MSDLAVQQVATEYISVGGTQLALPNYCRPDLAFSHTYNYGTLNAGTHVSQAVEGHYVEIPISLYFILATSNQLGSRLGTFQVLDDVGNVITQATALVAQSASLVNSYAANVGFTTAYGPVGTTNVFGFPAFAASAGYKMEVSAPNLQSNDVMSAATLTVTRVPTGPAFSTGTSPLIATPLVI